MGEWFVINDLEDFTNKTRAVVYNNFGKWDTEGFDANNDEVSIEDNDELNKVLSHKESSIIIKQNIRRQVNKKNNKVRYILDEQVFSQIVDQLNSRMVSNIITNLVQKGLVESAYDEKINDFIFWLTEENDEKNKTDKPETD